MCPEHVQGLSGASGSAVRADRVVPLQAASGPGVHRQDWRHRLCMGGGFALLLSADGYDAAAVNYGIVPPDIDELAAHSCPIVASYGGRDWTAKRVPALRDALRAHRVPHDVEVYPAAGHCFLNDELNGPLPFRPVMKLAHAGPEPASAADAWRRIEAFFATHLGSAPAQPVTEK
jgi:carboxymethylenebutenolidase